MNDASAWHCALCGTPARAPFHTSRAPELTPDLDMRPGEPVRFTLRDWIQSCRRCGAAAPDLATLPREAATVVHSAAYRAVSLSGAEDTAPFRRWAMICLASGDRTEAAEATLQAAWAADDGAAVVEAARLRHEVAALWSDSREIRTALRLLDVQRRAGDFAGLDATLARLSATRMNRFASSVVRFQRECAAARDVGRHLLSSAFADHVVPGDWPRPAFWKRLFEV